MRAQRTVEIVALERKMAVGTGKPAVTRLGGRAATPLRFARVSQQTGRDRGRSSGTGRAHFACSREMYSISARTRERT
jgi:hypothetical protein